MTLFDAARPPLTGLPIDELAARLAPIPAFRARQIFKWLRGGAASFDEMTDLPLALRAELDARWALRVTAVSQRLDAADRSLKLRLELADGHHIETVLLTDGAGRKTACLSTQAGCPVGCVFCKTGNLGFTRNLDAAEIVEQFYHLGAASGGEISNIVFMGMGEPLLNLEALRRAIAVLCAGFSTRRVTVSTCGILDGIRALTRDGPAVRLAVSLPSARQGLRERLMPAAAPLDSLKEVLAGWQVASGKRITLETALFAEVNTGAEDAAALAAFAAGLKLIINLIPWNPAEGLSLDGRSLARPSGAETARFQKALEERGLKVSVRREKGGALLGACGQLG